MPGGKGALCRRPPFPFAFRAESAGGKVNRKQAQPARRGGLLSGRVKSKLPSGVRGTPQKASAPPAGCLAGTGGLSPCLRTAVPLPGMRRKHAEKQLT
ncbi:MAG: hypothetical protein ACLVAA_11185 [Ruthenibacterium sp.]